METTFHIIGVVFLRSLHNKLFAEYYKILMVARLQHDPQSTLYYVILMIKIVVKLELVSET